MSAPAEKKTIKSNAEKHHHSRNIAHNNRKKSKEQRQR